MTTDTKPMSPASLRKMLEERDRVIELEQENKLLAQALANANEQAERFEREWYLRGDEIERLHEVSDEMFAAKTR